MVTPKVKKILMAKSVSFSNIFVFQAKKMNGSRLQVLCLVSVY